MAENFPVTGEAFSRWLAEVGPPPLDEQQEAQARSAWDAAIRAAWMFLDGETDWLVKGQRYPEAAVVRDCRQLLEGLFASPGQSGVERCRFERETEACIQKLRSVSPAFLDAMRRKAPPGSPRAKAVGVVLREREG